MNCNAIRMAFLRTELGKSPAIFLEWVTGVTLAEWIKSIHSTDISSPQPIDGHSTLICERKLESITQLALNISKALSEIHDAGVTHNNLGPKNIIVDETGENDTVSVKIIGLGSASLMTELNKMHMKARVDIL